MSNIIILLILIPFFLFAFLMIGMMGFSLVVDFMETDLSRFRKLREKNHCQKCGVKIPRGEKYCGKCTFERWTE